MATTARTIIDKAFSKMGIRAVGNTMSADDLTHGLSLLNDMIEEWAGDDLLIYSQTEENFPLVATQASYSIGESGSPDFDTARPQTILSGTFIRDSGGYDHPIEIIAMKKYRGITIKGNSGRPYYLAYNPTFPNGTIYLYHTPNSTESIYLRSLKELGSFAALTTEVTLPPGYNNALITGLAVAMSPDYGKTVGQELALLFTSAKRKIRSRSAQRADPVSLEVSQLNRRGPYNINNLWGG